MTQQEMSSRPELRAADDAVIEDAIAHADPMVLRGLLYQLTGDATLRAAAVAWFRRTLAFRRRGRGLAGFVTIEPRRARTVEHPDPGLLSGAAGIGLALLAASTPLAPAWDRSLLLDFPITGGSRRSP